jgi:hypothetical protein
MAEIRATQATIVTALQEITAHHRNICEYTLSSFPQPLQHSYPNMQSTGVSTMPPAPRGQPVEHYVPSDLQDSGPSSVAVRVSVTPEILPPVPLQRRDATATTHHNAIGQPPSEPQAASQPPPEGNDNLPAISHESFDNSSSDQYQDEDNTQFPTRWSWTRGIGSSLHSTQETPPSVDFTNSKISEVSFDLDSLDYSSVFSLQ